MREDAVEVVEAVREPGLMTLEVVEFWRATSPALSASVFRLGAGSGTVILSEGDIFESWRNMLVSIRVEPLCFKVGGGGIMERALFSEADISINPIEVEAGMRLGCLSPDGRIALVEWSATGRVCRARLKRTVFSPV